MTRTILTFLAVLLLALERPCQGQEQSRSSSPGTPSLIIARAGAQPSEKGASERFTGSVLVEPIFAASNPSHASGLYVTFQPGARAAWHTHPMGQTLIVTAGIGWVQAWGGAIEEIRQGDVVRIPPGVKHWHGASPTTAMTHVAVQEELDGKNVTWMEHVSDEQYASPRPTGGGDHMAKEPSAIKKSLGDFAPKLVEVTDDVLFGDVWERPELSKRDRSLITCAALVATGKTEQMDFHFPKAIKNGVTQEELVEMITHLAFYVGWPNAISAVNRAKELSSRKEAR